MPRDYAEIFLRDEAFAPSRISPGHIFGMMQVGFDMQIKNKIKIALERATIIQ